jgi:HlyD family secretion protein
MIGVSQLTAIKNGFFRLTKAQRIVAVILLACLAWFIFAIAGPKKNTGVTYQTGTVEKGTLIVSVDASGQATTANSASVTTQTSGVVNKLYVQNGQKVATGDPIAEVELDMDGRQRSAAALAGYQSAKNALDNANTALYTLKPVYRVEELYGHCPKQHLSKFGRFAQE